MRVTRSRSVRESEAEIPIISGSEPSRQEAVASRNQSIPKKKRSSPNHTVLLKNAKLSIQNSKPAYLKRPHFKPKVSKDPLEYIERCKTILENSNIAQFQPEVEKHVTELQKFKIFKDMSQLDMKTVRLLRSVIGELKEEDKALVKVLESEPATEAAGKEFYKLYGIEYLTDPVAVKQKSP